MGEAALMFLLCAEPARAIRFAFILCFALHGAYLFQSGRLCAAC